MRGSCTGEHVCKDGQPSGTAAASHPTGGKPAAVAQAASGQTEGSSDEGSPRSVVQRTFSLSNLFGLASW